MYCLATILAPVEIIWNLMFLDQYRAQIVCEWCMRMWESPKVFVFEIQAT